MKKTATLVFVIGLSVSGMALSEKASKKDSIQKPVPHDRFIECTKKGKSDEECEKEALKECPMLKEGKSCPAMEGNTIHIYDDENP